MSLRHLRLLTLGLALAMLCGCTKWPEKKHPDWKVATSGEQITKLFWDDVKAKKWKEVDAHVGPKFVGLSAQASIDRAGALEHLHKMELQEFQIGELQTNLVGNDLITTYVLTVKGTSGGQPLPSSPIRMMSIWQEVKSGWILVAHTSIPTGP